MKKRIFTICNQLIDQGIKPTLTRVRNELGGGSFSTINPFFKQWKEDQKMCRDTYVIDLHTEIAAINQKAAVLILKATNDYCHKAQTNQEEALKTLQIKVAKAEVIISTLRMELEAARKEKSELEKMVMLRQLTNTEPKFKLTTIQ